MNKKELALLLSEKTNLSKKEARRVIDLIFQFIARALIEKESVDIVGFGKFEVVERSGRKGVDPNTKLPIYVGSHKRISFKTSTKLRNEIKNLV